MKKTSPVNPEHERKTISSSKKTKVSKLINREESWLVFNERVLQEARNPKIPVCERIKFLGIFSSNLNEFYRVRVAILKRSFRHSRNAKKIFKEIKDKVIQQREQLFEIFFQIKKELKKHNINIKTFDEINQSDKQFLWDYFSKELMPVIHIYNINYLQHLKDHNSHMILSIQRHRNMRAEYWIIEIPTHLFSRFVCLPSEMNKNGEEVKTLAFVDDAIRVALPSVFQADESLQAYSFRLLRDADFDIENDLLNSTFDKFKSALGKRAHGNPVRLNFDLEMPPKLLKKLKDMLKISPQDCIPSWKYQNFRDLLQFPELGQPDTKFINIAPLHHPNCHFEFQPQIFLPKISEDIMLHYPYNSFNQVIYLLHTAAIDPRVVSIKITLYRLALKSKVINALMLAARNGKKVDVTIEFHARFDEEANLNWAYTLQTERIVIYPQLNSLKIHAKVFLIEYEEDDRTSYIGYVGTGNFNEDTTKYYGDHGLITANENICGEIKNFFDYLHNPHKHYDFQHLIVAPINIRHRFEKLIDREIKNYRRGLVGKIRLKINNLSDVKMIKALYHAAHCGVKVEIICRSVCCLDPQFEAGNENIKIISIVDRYLEHSRLFYFENGGESEVYLGSSDWMERNLDRRVEVVVKVPGDKIKQELIAFLDLQWNDNTKARIIDRTLSNRFVPRPRGAPVINAQTQFYDLLQVIYDERNQSASAD
jgi:polyphosphate kinase